MALLSKWVRAFRLSKLMRLLMPMVCVLLVGNVLQLVWRGATLKVRILPTRVLPARMICSENGTHQSTKLTETYPGGGHSALTSLYGLGADQALEWEVVTASGAHIIATPTQNPSLYWALSGGGGGTYGVVISLTAKAHPDGPVGGATLTVLPTGITQDAFWEAVGLWHASLPAIVDSGAMAVHFVTPAFMQVFGLTAPGATTQDVNTLLHPYTSQLDARNISYTLSVTSFPTYYQHFDKYFGPLPLGVFAASQLTGGRLIPRSVVQTNNAALTATTRSIASNPNFLFTGIALSAAQPAPHVPNSVLPAWRTAIMSVAIIGTWNSSLPLAANHAVETELTNSIVPQLEALTPGSGCYLNEANFDQPNWQQDFYGANYWPLRAVKRAFDPLDLFYARTAVGSEVWGEDGVGRLCRV